MTTPNEDLILKLRGQAYTTCRPDQLCDQAADLLQSQAERIKELEAEIDNIKAVEFPRRLDKVTQPIIAERDTLRAQLADAELHTKQVERGLDKALAQLEKIAATEPSMIYHGRCVIDCGDSGHQDVTMLKMIARETKLFTHPMPAQDVDAVAWVSVAKGDVSKALLYFDENEEIKPLGVIGEATTRTALSSAKGAK